MRLKKMAAECAESSSPTKSQRASIDDVSAGGLEQRKTGKKLKTGRASRGGALGRAALGEGFSGTEYGETEGGAPGRGGPWTDEPGRRWYLVGDTCAATRARPLVER
jgi:hypothetical protein